MGIIITLRYTTLDTLGFYIKEDIQGNDAQAYIDSQCRVQCDDTRYVIALALAVARAKVDDWPWKVGGWSIYKVSVHECRARRVQVQGGEHVTL